VRCPCGSLSPYDGCCGLVHSGTAPAATATALMRSRYSAFAVGDSAWLLRSWHSSTRPRSLELDPDQLWDRLVILGTTAGGLFEAEGTVEFRALSTHRGRSDVVHENSRFVRENGLWVYVTALPQGAVSSPSSNRPPGTQSVVR
jgi:SEC-C motif-containing protein